jgi:hypothetical protein
MGHNLPDMAACKLTLLTEFQGGLPADQQHEDQLRTSLAFAVITSCAPCLDVQVLSYPFSVAKGCK